MPETPEIASNSLFGRLGVSNPGNPCSVGKYNRSVERQIQDKNFFPHTWVKAVITQLNVRGKVAYLTIAEFDEGDAKPKAVLDVFMWARQLEEFNQRFAQLPTPFSLHPELKVSLLLEANFYVPTGRFQPRIVDVDEAHTLGELSLTRKKILDRLLKEGLIERNKKQFLSDAPLRIGLITSHGSAAYQDFTTVLLQSGFSFEIFFVSGRMQGSATEETVVAAFEALSHVALDVICLIRGGGSKTDLVFFDSEKICRAIALCPIPVLTGIGHEIDRSLADVVAYADLLTPTDCAKFLEGRVEDAYQGLRRRAAGLGETWRTVYQATGYDAIRAAESLRASWENRSRQEISYQSEMRKGITAGVRRMFHAAREKLILNLKGLSRGPFKISRLEIQGLELKERLVQSADPAVLLRKGFALVFSGDGKWIRGAADLVDGEEIRTRFHDGDVRSKVQSKERHS